MNFRFVMPWALTLIVLIPVFVFLSRKFENSVLSSIRFSHKGLTDGIKDSFRIRAAKKLIYLRSAAIVLMIVAFARPQSMLEETRRYVEGIDIVLALDVSGSMRAMDFELHSRKVDRVEAMLYVVRNFVRRRTHDRIGIVAFAGVAYTVCPLTLDHEWVERNLDRVEIGMIEDGTAIGTALIGSLNRLKDSDSRERVIILLTDGRNNAGWVSPLAAAEAARAMGVTVHTIAMGTTGSAPYPFQDRFGNVILREVEIPIDEELLREIADITGGAYFSGDDTASLERVYRKIDELEKTVIEETGYHIYRELFPLFLVPGLILLLVGSLLSDTFLRRLPS